MLNVRLRVRKKSQKTRKILAKLLESGLIWLASSLWGGVGGDFSRKPLRSHTPLYTAVAMTILDGNYGKTTSKHRKGLQWPQGRTPRVFDKGLYGRGIRKKSRE